MGDALSSLGAAGRAYERGDLEGGTPGRAPGYGWEIDEETGQLSRVRKTAEQIEREREKRVLDSARLLSSIPQLGSKPGLGSLTGGS